MSKKNKNKILLIEDEYDIANLIFNGLEIQDFIVHIARCGDEALDLIQNIKPDLILCDIMMRGIDGYEVLKRIRENEATQTIPFIFLTAKTQKNEIRKGMDLGADDYITKPFKLEELIFTINSRLNKHSKFLQENKKKLDNLRKDIIYALPHEFFTPLSIIMGNSELLIERTGAFDIDTIKRITTNIYNSSQKLERIIHNYVTYIKIDDFHSNPEKFYELREEYTIFVEKIIRDVSIKKAKEFKREDDLIIFVENLHLNIATEDFKKIVEEIIDNAFKFSQKGTAVKISSIKTKYDYILKISNSGRGMTPEQIENIDLYTQFERKFYEQQGLGLGLSIAIQLVKLYSGEISISSVPGNMTEVIIKLKRRILNQ